MAKLKNQQDFCCAYVLCKKRFFFELFYRCLRRLLVSDNVHICLFEKFRYFASFINIYQLISDKVVDMIKALKPFVNI